MGEGEGREVCPLLQGHQVQRPERNTASPSLAHCHPLAWITLARDSRENGTPTVGEPLLISSPLRSFQRLLPLANTGLLMWRPFQGHFRLKLLERRYPIACCEGAACQYPWK